MISTAHGEIATPAFLPDATLGAVRSLDSADLEIAGTTALVMNTFHLMQHPGSSTVKALGGLHQMAAWRRPILTDSGGFQAYSLIRQNARYGSLGPKGITFRPENGERDFSLSPEKTVQLQLAYGADIAVVLDDCRHVDESEDAHRESVERTIDWARRGRREYDRLIGSRKKGAARPLLFGVIQGGGSKELRRRCAEELLAIGFDGFGFGGWPLDAKGNLLDEIVGYTRALVPRDIPMHALGIGHPENVVACAAQGYDTFDSALPTRDARDGRLYTRRDDARWFAYLYVQDVKHTKADAAVFPGCGCYSCQRYPLGYLHHLYKVKETLYYRLATLHNLHYMNDLTARLRA